MVVADPDEALIEAIAEALRTVDDAALVETNFSQLSATYDDAARAAYAAMVAHLGLVEETKLIPEWVDLGPCNGTCRMVQCNPEHRVRGLNWVNKRRLVSRWVEVDHGSE